LSTSGLWYTGQVRVHNKHLQPFAKLWQFEGGALPYFEDMPAFSRRLDPFWA
jgi:predicted restriction endonuclease